MSPFVELKVISENPPLLAWRMVYRHLFRASPFLRRAFADLEMKGNLFPTI